jgi:hypothetical protein
MAINTMTGAEFKEKFLPFIKNLKDDDEVFFGGGDLSFNRFKERGPVVGPKLHNIEFNEAYKVTSD